MGIITNAYIQQASGTFLESLTSDGLNMNRCVQVCDIFAMSKSSFDLFEKQPWRTPPGVLLLLNT